MILALALAGFVPTPTITQTSLWSALFDIFVQVMNHQPSSLAHHSPIPFALRALWLVRLL
jgi:hypothetical protein